MKRVGYITDKDGRRITLLEAMGDYGNVQKAYNKARKCKRHRKDVLIFTKDKEENLDKVREDIINLAYEPSKYHYFKVYEPKERQIMALPFYDRVVQHAINNVLEPIFDKRFISQSYACRKGKGMHAASDTLKEWLYEWNKYHPDQPLYAIKADIHHYFQSIDHAVLKTEIRKVIKDAGVLALLDRIIDHNGNMPDGVGIPVGKRKFSQSLRTTVCVGSPVRKDKGNHSGPWLWACVWVIQSINAKPLSQGVQRVIRMVLQMNGYFTHVSGNEQAECT